MYKNKMMSEHKLRRGGVSAGQAKRPTRSKKASGPVMSVVISSAQYAAFEKANKTGGGIVLNLVSAGNVNKKGRGKPFTGKMIVILD